MTAHSGGTATCTEKAVCKDCKAEYGDPLGHAWKDTWMDDKDAHWHECEDENCPVTDDSKKDEYGAHIDADSDKYCDVCKTVLEVTETQIVKEELDSVPAELKDLFDSVGELKVALMSRILTTPGYSAGNTVFYDVKLQFSLDGGKTWIDATEDNFPKKGITVKFDYPEGTSGDTHDFKISHMFTVTSERLKTTAGGTEQPDVIELEDGIQATFRGLSPVSISWIETAQNTPTDPTGEPTTPEGGMRKRVVFVGITGKQGCFTEDGAPLFCQ